MIYTSPDKTASVAFKPNGIYTGLVTRVDTANQRVWVMIPRVANGFQFGPLTVLSSDLPAVNDRVGCVFVENRADDVVVLGSIKSSTSPVFATPVTCSSTTRPTDRPVGTIIYETDTTKTLIWNGSQWTGLNIDTLLVDSDTLYVDATNNRVGINTATPTVALDVDGSMAASSIYSSSSITAVSALIGGSVSTSGQVSAGSVYTSGQVSGGSVVATGPVTANDISATTTVTAQRFISTQTTGTSPLTVASTTVVSNLNADLLDGQEGTHYTNATNISSGTLAIAYGGTNASATPTAGTIAYGTGTAYAFSSAGTSGDYLTSAGSSAPTWTTPPFLYGTTANRPGSPAAGTLYYNTTLARLEVYHNSFVGWNLPWDSPWGQLGLDTVTAATTATSSTYVGTGLSLTVAVVKNRLIQWRWYSHAYSDVANAVVRVGLRNAASGGSEIQVADHVTPAASVATALSGMYVEAPSVSGNLGRNIAVNRIAGTGNVYHFADSLRYGYLIAEDIGPNTSTPPTS